MHVANNSKDDILVVNGLLSHTFIMGNMVADMCVRTYVCPCGEVMTVPSAAKYGWKTSSGNEYS